MAVRATVVMRSDPFSAPAGARSDGPAGPATAKAGVFEAEAPEAKAPEAKAAGERGETKAPEAKNTETKAPKRRPMRRTRRAKAGGVAATEAAPGGAEVGESAGRPEESAA